MSQINPFAGSIVQASGVQRQMATDKERQAQRIIDKRKDSGATGDRFEHSIESSDEVAPIHDEQKDQPSKKRQQQHTQQDDEKSDDDNGEPHLDLTA
jgi:hypothetical protein